MERLYELLMETDDTIDYKHEHALIDDRLLDSFAIISLIGDMEDVFDISIDAAEIVPANFNSMDAMWTMIQRLQEN